MKKPKRQVDRGCAPQEAAFIARLRAAGCPVPDGSNSSLGSDLVVEIASASKTTMYFSRSAVECVLAVRLMNHSYTSLQIRDCKIRLPWNAPDLNWLCEPLFYSGAEKKYRLPSGRAFAWDSVLNPIIVHQGELPAQRTVEGLLLAHSPEPIAADSPHGEVFPAGISITDQYGRGHVSAIQITADRTATINWLALQRRPGKGLFEPAPESDQRTSLSAKSNVNVVLEQDDPERRTQ
jgi:hypothetical protein